MKGGITAYLNLLSDDFQIYWFLNNGKIIWILLNGKKDKLCIKSQITHFTDNLPLKAHIPFWREASGTAR